MSVTTPQSEKVTRLQEMMRIAVALTAERDLNRLLELILTTARQLTHADAGSLYLTEFSEEETQPAQLRFILSQNESVPFTPPTNILLAVDETSIAGYVAMSGESVNLDDVYRLGGRYPFHFNPEIDRKIGYRTKSVITVPMQTPQGQILGVIQLINRKRSPGPLVNEEDFDQRVIPFSQEDRELLQSLASQAAIAYQNNQLLHDIQHLFESFIKAAVFAVEQRDPTTSGHSSRVAHLTLALARAVHETSTGPYADVRFGENHFKELYYAAILHDFGKIGVREHVLVKHHKLYDVELERIRRRFAIAVRTLQWRTEKQKVEYLLVHGPESAELYFKELDDILEREIGKLEEYLQIIHQANLPTVLPEGDFTMLQSIAQETYEDLDGTRRPLLEPSEVSRLSIRKGSLDMLERAEIESHVTRTFEFLSQIPWTRELRKVPEYAYGHHEKLDGSGYPRHLRDGEIPIQARMMTIADIFDALTAQDRPYKKSVPPERALEILANEVEQGHLDPELFRIFKESRVWTRTPSAPGFLTNVPGTP